MKVKYVGDPRDNNSGPEELQAYGQKFLKNKVVDIDVDEDTAKRIAGNSHFEVTATKGDKNTRRNAADQVEEEDGAIIGSTTGDPETATREQRIAQSEQRQSATEAMGEPGPDSKGPRVSR